MIAPLYARISIKSMRQRKQEQGQKSELRAVKRAADAIDNNISDFWNR